MQVREGLHYNPYFPGGAIAMPKMLADEGTEYDDDSVFATESQQAKVGSHESTLMWLMYTSILLHVASGMMLGRWSSVVCLHPSVP